MILTIAQTSYRAEKISTSTFKKLDILEQKIQEWVRTNPGMLMQGEDSVEDDGLLIVSKEFDKFRYKDDLRSIADRLDLLAIDRKGNLVVIEFKRDKQAGHAELQALRYAAMISSMTFAELIPIYVEYLRKFLPPGGDAVTPESARQQIVDFAFPEGSAQELTKNPRIILCSQNFSPQITTTVLWLQPKGIDITCVKITPYEVDEKIVIVPSVIIPLKEAKEYQVEIARKEAAQTQAQVEAERGSRFDFKKLLKCNLLDQGDVLHFTNIPKWSIHEEGDPIFQAIVTGDYPSALEWTNNGVTIVDSPSRLASRILTVVHPDGKAHVGNADAKNRWINKSGDSLARLEEIANERLDECD